MPSTLVIKNSIWQEYEQGNLIGKNTTWFTRWLIVPSIRASGQGLIFRHGKWYLDMRAKSMKQSEDPESTKVLTETRIGGSESSTCNSIQTITIMYIRTHSLCQRAKLRAGIKPTALCSAFDKENSIEFPLDFLLYLYKFLTLTLYQSPMLLYESLLSTCNDFKQVSVAAPRHSIISLAGFKQSTFQGVRWLLCCFLTTLKSPLTDR